MPLDRPYKDAKAMPRDKTTRPRYETELARPVTAFLESQGYTVRSEVNDCDIVGTRDGHTVVVELKRSFTVSLLAQAADRQRVADAVYVALPRPAEPLRGKHWRRLRHLLRRLELGLILVSFTAGRPRLQIVFHPTPFARKRDSRRRGALLREVEGRSGDFNRGGSTGRKLVTAYRENAIHIACGLEALGDCSPAALRNLGTGPKTRDILYNNVYDWFERVDRGVYRLKDAGRSALKEYPGLAEHYRNQIARMQEKERE
ncbi:MAG TPA: DUF2161 family putative PD-(D/E)XK-type phosphodiesterase [Candidatus Hydrogenedentes bacterium]|nr:DUF2161 family putative PD-(D/E)XK-type phosphodiesterase [Candidatus Hydrogenedentota bacterium]